MRKPTTIKAEIAENKELLKAAGLLADEKAFIEDEIADLEKELEEALKAEATPKKPTATKKAAPKKKKTAAKKKTTGKKKAAIVFKVGDVFDTQGNSNMEGEVTIKEMKGNSLFFIDENEKSYQGFSKTTARKLIEGGSWKKVSSAKKSTKPKEKKFVMVGDEKVFEDDPKFCEIIIDKWKARKEAIKKAAGKRKTKSVIQRAAADVADAVSKGIRNFKVDEIKKDPKKAIAKMEKLEKAGKEFIDAYKDIIGEKITQKEIKEEFEGLDKAIKQISEKYLKEKQKMAKGGQTDSDVIIIPNIKGLKKFVDGITNVNHKDYGKFKGRGNRRLIKNINGVEFSENYPILKVTNRYAYYYDIDSQTDKFLDAPFKVKLKQKMAKGGEVNTAKPLTQIEEEISKLSFKPVSFIVVVTEDAWENTGDPYNLDVYRFDNLEDAYQKFVEELKDIKNMYASENPDYKGVALEAWDEDDYEMEVLDDERYDVSYEDDYGKLVIQYQHVGKGMNYAHKFIGLFFLDEYTEKNLSNNPDKMFSTWTNILDITEEDLRGLTYDEAVEKIKDEANLKLQNNITLDDIIDAIDIIYEDEDED